MGKEKTKEISLSRYCDIVKRPLQSVSRDIKNGKLPYGVISSRYESQRRYVTVHESFEDHIK